ncbi:hypothetical protein LEN26_013780 [Aphanomyces euteiches]|nr:hypothetical protein LEN26_013780 [Aphanomyces euteiches]KAH9116502.1 hypothetical protein AeMF1_009538 [Aphanomyces euteiches]KAH9184829.1 hypothetical protein AeNC1_013197 [Aphanomyces euteiches]
MNPQESPQPSCSRQNFRRPDVHMCIVCGAGPFCGDHIGLHFDLCFEAHCPVTTTPTNTPNIARPPTMCQPRRHAHGVKIQDTHACLDPLDEDHECAFDRDRPLSLDEFKSPAVVNFY